jgi:hypothetical protein
MAFIEGAEPTGKCTLHGGWFDSWWNRDRDKQGSIE